MSRKTDRRGLLIVLPGGLGDLVQAQDVLQGVARQSPGETDLLTGESLVSLARSWGVFRAVMGLREDVLYHGTPIRRAALLIRTVNQLRGGRYQRALLLKAHAAYGGVAWAAGIPTRAGFRRGFAPFLTHAVPLRGDVHRVDRVRELASLVAPRPLDPLPERRRAAGHPGGNMRIGIAPGGARNAKEEMPCRRWPLANYLAAATALAARHPDATFVLLGSGGDRNECDAMMSVLPAGRTVNRCGALQLEALQGEVAALDLLITHDSALLHVAGRSGCGVVGIFGPTDPRVVAPRGEGVATLWQPAGGHPCHDEVSGRVNCAASPCCIERVNVDAVLRAADELLQGSGAGR